MLHAMLPQREMGRGQQGWAVGAELRQWAAAAGGARRQQAAAVGEPKLSPPRSSPPSPVVRHALAELLAEDEGAAGEHRVLTPG